MTDLTFVLSLLYAALMLSGGLRWRAGGNVLWRHIFAFGLGGLIGLLVGASLFPRSNATKPQ